MRAPAVLVLAALLVDAPFQIVASGDAVEERGISRGAAWGDYDGDGDPDLFVTRPPYDGSAQTNRLYRNDGDGRLTRVPGVVGPSAWWEGVTWVDVDNDGDLDLHLVGRRGAGSLFLRNDTGALRALDADPFGGAVTSASMACWADADGDGLLDAFVIGYNAGRNALFQNVGGWRFQAIPLEGLALGDGSARSCGWGDMDGDRLPELAIANAQSSNVLLRNRGGMRLVPDTTTPLHGNRSYSYGLSWTDVNGDGVRDLFVANFDAGNALYLGAADGSLTPVALGEQLQSPASKGHTWGDFDLDGHVDAYVGSGTPGPGMFNRLYFGAADGTFRLSLDGDYAQHADTSAAIASADVDLDGDLDLFVANWGSSGSVNRLYRNTASGTTRGQGWLRVQLRGTASNRMAVGARVSARVSRDGTGRWMHRWLDLSTGYAGQNEPVIHFGLGEASRVDSLVVAWPSGAHTHVGAAAGGRTVTLREPPRR